MVLRLTLGLVALAALGAPALAREEVLNGVVLDVPKGWEIQRGDAGSLILQKELPETDDYDLSAVLIQLVVPRGIEGSLAQGLATMVNAVPDLADEDTTDDAAGVTTNGHEMLMQYRCCGEVQEIDAALTTVAVGSSTKQAFLQMLAMNLYGDREDEIEAEFATMARTLRLEESDPPFLVAPQQGDGGLDGVYTYLRTGVMPNMFGGMDFISENELMVFDPSGLYSDSMPVGADMEGYCADNPRDCGTYKVSGGGFWGGERKIETRKVINDFGTVSVDVESLEMRGDDGIAINENFHKKLPGFPAETSFDGEWRYFWAQSGNSAFSSGSIAVERLLVMTQDGRFERSGFSGASGNIASGDGSTGYATHSDSPVAAGRYRVDGYTLVLIGDDGKEEVLSIFAPDIGSDGLLVINGSNYLKQD